MKNSRRRSTRSPRSTNSWSRPVVTVAFSGGPSRRPSTCFRPVASTPAGSVRNHRGRRLVDRRPHAATRRPGGGCSARASRPGLRRISIRSRWNALSEVAVRRASRPATSAAAHHAPLVSSGDVEPAAHLVLTSGGPVVRGCARYPRHRRQHVVVPEHDPVQVDHQYVPARSGPVRPTPAEHASPPRWSPARPRTC